jgi:hypothetical protein
MRKLMFWPQGVYVEAKADSGSQITQQADDEVQPFPGDGLSRFQAMLDKLDAVTDFPRCPGRYR